MELRELLTDAERTQFVVVSIATQLSFAESERLVQVTYPPWRQPRGKKMGFLVNSHSSDTSRR